MKHLERVRWRARRGLLELDIVLARFIETHYVNLTETERAAFETLLDMPDTRLWDMISGRQQATQATQCALLERMNSI
ncbi:MAG: succinate dehydrogenase assembly factor 2 [Pseudomonadota bacterium]